MDKKKQFIVCIDSDGCAMDTMNAKHIEYFGPELVKEWNIVNDKKFLETWNKVNLFSKTRGINRFKGFVETFRQMEEKNEKIGEIDQIEKWVNTTDELSNKSLESEIKDLKGKIEVEKLKQLEKLLNWSKNVNIGIKKLEGRDRPFEKVKEAMEKIKENADIAVVSSANKEAILSEWTRHNLMKYVNVIYSQEEGTKKDCINKVKENGYEENKILMVGDSPGDLEAAKDNNVLFFPILFDKEKEYWEEIINIAMEKFLTGNYKGDYENNLIKKFNENLLGQ